MPVVRQLSLFLANKPGALARLCDSFAKAKVNLIAISVQDSVDHAVVRMVVDQPDAAIALLEEHGVLVVDTEVLSVKLPNQPGSLARLASRLSEAKINIEYAYGTAAGKSGSSMLVLRTNNLAKARRVLKA